MKIADKAYIIFCDDVRDEVGNKLSLMGIYSDKLVVQSLPIQLRTFNIVASLEKLKKSVEKFRIIFTLPGAKPIDVSSPQAPSTKGQKNANIVFGLAPLRIESAGMATAAVYINDAEKPEVEKNIEIVLQPQNTK